MANAKRQPKRRKKIMEYGRSGFLGPVRKELVAAYTTVGGTPPKRLRWLLEFAYMNLTDLTQGRLADLGWEVAMFGVNKRPNHIENDVDSLGDLLVLADSFMSDEFDEV